MSNNNNKAIQQYGDLHVIVCFFFLIGTANTRTIAATMYMSKLSEESPAWLLVAMVYLDEWNAYPPCDNLQPATEQCTIDLKHLVLAIQRHPLSLEVYSLLGMW